MGTRVCITCSDQAIPGRVQARLPGGIGAVEINGTTEEISLELCDAVEGDSVLVHTGTTRCPIATWRTRRRKP